MWGMVAYSNRRMKARFSHRRENFTVKRVRSFRVKLAKPHPVRWSNSDSRRILVLASGLQLPCPKDRRSPAPMQKSDPQIPITRENSKQLLPLSPFADGPATRATTDKHFGPRKFRGLCPGRAIISLYKSEKISFKDISNGNFKTLSSKLRSYSQRQPAKRRRRLVKDCIAASARTSIRHPKAQTILR